MLKKIKQVDCCFSTKKWSNGAIKLTSKKELRKMNGKRTRALRIDLVFYYVFSRHFLLNYVENHSPSRKIKQLCTN
jgi:hypothetical protein